MMLCNAYSRSRDLALFRLEDKRWLVLYYLANMVFQAMKSIIFA